VVMRTDVALRLVWRFSECWPESGQIALWHNAQEQPLCWCSWRFSSCNQTGVPGCLPDSC